MYYEKIIKFCADVFVFNFCSSTKKANAGFMILATVQEFVWKHKYETLDTVLVIALPVTMIATGIFAVGIPGNPFNNATLVAGVICLNEDLAAKRNDIKVALVQRYPFIDDEEVINELTDLIISRYSKIKDDKGNAYITLSSEEVEEIIAHKLDLNNNEKAELVKTLGL